MSASWARSWSNTRLPPTTTCYLVDLLEQEGAEANVPDLMGFMLYCFYNQVYKAENLGTSKKTAMACNIGIRTIEGFLGPINRAYKKSRHFDPPASIYQLVKYAEPIVSIGNETGEGWFLTGEMIELIHSGVENIVCIQPGEHCRHRLRSRRQRSQPAQPY